MVGKYCQNKTPSSVFRRGKRKKSRFLEKIQRLERKVLFLKGVDLNLNKILKNELIMILGIGLGIPKKKYLVGLLKV